MDKKELRIVFMGTPEFAVATLQRLVEKGYNVVAVVTQPDKPVGRHAEMKAPEVKQYAVEQGIPVFQPERMKDEKFLAELKKMKADLQVVVAFRMLPEVVWAMPRFGTFNLHASLLPQYRGAAPINWAIINGEKETGVTTFFLNTDIDTGQIIAQKRCPIPEDANVEQLYNTLKGLGADLVEETLEAIIKGEGNVTTTPQDHTLATKPAPKLFKDNCRINWDTPAKEVYNFIRGLSPTPGAWTRLSFNNDGEAQEVKIYGTQTTNEECKETPGTMLVERKRLLVATKDYWTELIDLQIAGKRRMKAVDIINGLR